MSLFDSVDCSLPGSTVHGSFQARILELVAISYSHLSTVYQLGKADKSEKGSPS